MTAHTSVNGSIITLSNVSVEYRVPTESIPTIKEYIIRMIQQRSVGHRTFMALQDLNIEVPASQAVGIIGSNGAGKSTLLKVISRIMRPTRGRVVVAGRVAPLIELGAGFHQELTGRENIYLNGAMLGFSRGEMDEKYDSILDFAELESFIDAPLRTYSSGMVMRLGFAIASDVDPDILIIDEILAVGDGEFQEKCMRRMRRFRENGTTILFVSHALDAVLDICERAIWIDHGKIQADGPSETVVEAYRSSFTHAA
jgi:ABC-type polysaccharide/polyol phosphate transport system ATPase subunit